MITFTKVSLPYGWLGNMSPHAVTHNGVIWRTTEALFQALRFIDDNIKETIRLEKSPMAAKFIAKRHKNQMVVIPASDEDVANMCLVLTLKLDQHPNLKKELLETGNQMIIEDCTKRRPSIWGAQRIGDKWEGENLLGKIWMELRDELRKTLSD